MKNQKIAKGLFIALCTLALTGCERKESQSSNTSNTSSTNNTSSKENQNITSPTLPANESNTAPTANDAVNDAASTDANALFEDSAIQGRVVEFSENGCIISPVISEEDGQSSKIAAPGNENSDTNVNIQYQENCVFQIAVINTATGKADIRDTSISEIKKQTNLIIYGEFQDTHNLTASKVFISRYE